MCLAHLCISQCAQQRAWHRLSEGAGGEKEREYEYIKVSPLDVLHRLELVEFKGMEKRVFTFS